MPYPPINDTTPFKQYVATGGQTTFVYDFLIYANTDIKVYKRGASASPNDSAQILELGEDYTVTGVGSLSGGNVVLLTGATAGDIISITRDFQLTRGTDFQPGNLTSDNLNLEFNRIIGMIQDAVMAIQKVIPNYNFSEIFNPVNNRLPSLPAGHVWRMNDSATGIGTASLADSDPGASILRSDLASHATSKGASLVGIVGGAGTVQDFYEDIIARLIGINRINYGVDTGAANALVVTLSKPISAYADGQLFLVKVAANNTGASTINIDGKGAIGIKYLDGNDLDGGDLLAGRTAFLSYYSAGGYAILLNPDYVRRGDSSVVVQEVSSKTSAYLTGSTTMPLNDSIRQNTEGDQYFSLSITPKKTTNILRIRVLAHTSGSVPHNMGMALFQDSSVNALAVSYENNQTADTIRQLELDFEMAAGAVSPTTFKVRIGMDNAGTTMINGTTGARIGGGILYSSISITELSA